MYTVLVNVCVKIFLPHDTDIDKGCLGAKAPLKTDIPAFSTVTEPALCRSESVMRDSNIVSPT